MGVSYPGRVRAVRVALVVCTAVGAAGAVAGFVGVHTPWAAALAAGTVVAVGLPIVLGWLVARRLPAHPTAWLLAACGAAIGVTFGLPGVAATPLAGDWMVIYLPFAYLLLLHPDGHLPSPRWRPVAWALPAVAVAFNAGAAVVWARPALEAPLQPLVVVLLLAFFALLLSAALSLVPRYRRSDERTRVQLRWVVLAGVSVPLTLLLCWLSYLVLGGPDLVGIGVAVMALAIPAAAAVGLLAPRRFDVDRVAAGTVTGAALGALALAALTAASAVAGLAVARWSAPVAVVATVVVTLAVAPLYRSIRRRIDRLVYPDRERSRAAVTLLAERVRHGTAQPEQVEAVLREALRDPGLRVGYRSLVGTGYADAGGVTLAPGPDAVAVRLGPDEVGVLVGSGMRAKRPPREAAELAAPLVEAVRLRAELTRALGEVAASRERLVRATYDERRRLERDLHDGAQQRLVALGMSLRVLQRAHPADGGLAAALDRAVAELSTAVAELRQLAHGVRPSALDDGLAAALGELVRGGDTPVDLRVDAVDLPDAVSTTAYFVASEAVTNALRHADATRIGLRVERLADAVRVEVSDDGRGGATVRPGGGLAGLHDRVGALGGALRVRSGAGVGTVVEAVLPCAS